MAKPLDEYQRKRDFAATPEPSGSMRAMSTRRAQALQFVIQKHDASHLHYDFRLELEGTLKSWAVPKGPCLDPTVKRLAVQVEDHPLDYAQFEGRIPKGHYGAGEVIVWDRGSWLPLGDPQMDYARGRLKFELRGEKLSGVWSLVRTRMAGKKAQWFLVKSRDAEARALGEFDVLSERPDSVLSERVLVPRKRAADAKPVAKGPRRRAASKVNGPDEALRGAVAAPMPDALAPQLATLVERVPEGAWQYEIKFDGYRLLTRIRGDQVCLFTRNGHDWTGKLPGLAQALGELGLESAWLDGEIVAAGEDGVSSFQHLQNAFESGQDLPIHYYLFDLPYLNGVDLRQVPLEQRRVALATVLAQQPHSHLRFSETFSESPEQLLTSSCQLRFEGLIGKRCGSPYASRRNGDWIKLKCQHRQEFVIAGYTDPQGTRSVLGALLLGLYHPESGELRYAGRVGSGFSEQTLRQLQARFQSLLSKKTPLSNPPHGQPVRGVHWLKPELVAEVAYAELTRDGAVRHAVFHGLRADKPAQAICLEQPLSAVSEQAPAKADTTTVDRHQTALRITHPDRIIDRSCGISKRELAEFYAQVAPWILPRLKGRPIALVRGPEGIEGELFFQKHVNRLEIPGITQLDSALDPDHAALMVINRPEALVGAAQMGMLELHSWNASLPNLEKPDCFVLDLDPDPALPWARMIEATQLVLTLLDEIGLVGFLKTSGGKGIHIRVPLTRRQGWETVKAFSQDIARYLARLMPERFTATAGPKNRLGRIFIDYLRNGRGASTVTPFSARARPGLPVSVPIYREELADLQGAATWTIRNLLQRLDALGTDDPWGAMANTRQSISAEMRKRLGGHA
ncbi:MAG: DNA ligase D [Pseudomonas sp.]|uniref:DNA ligase D n=1 Tax=Pseudomonas sp. TaxID=306 RepID=UPI0033961BC4